MSIIEISGKVDEAKRESEFVLVQDDDCHWYVIPYKGLKPWSIWIAEDCPILPDWAKIVGGSPTLVLFKEYKIL